MNHRYLQKFQIKDVVFLAIMSAVALATCAVMPLVISLQPLIFGISQLVTALQIGVFFAIGLYKVRKPGSLLLMALMMGLIQLMMSPPMFLSSVLNGVLIELIVLLLFRGYERDAAVFVAAMLHTPLSLPFNYLYNRLMKGADSPLAAVADRAPLAAVGMTLAVVAVSALGAQNIGAGRPERAAATLRYAVMIAVGFGLIAAAVVQFAAEPIVALFTDGSAADGARVIRFGGQYLRGYIWDCVFAGIHFSFSGYFCACGKSGLSFMHNIASITLVRVPGAYLAARLFPETLFPMGLTSAAGSLLSVLICLIAFAVLRRKKSG